MEEKFNLGHVALYAKHWYKRFNKQGLSKRKTIFDDLKCCMTADGYCGEFMSDTDVISILLTHCKRINKRAFTDLSEFFFGIQDYSVWKNGYYTKTNDMFNRKRDDNPDYDYNTAVVYYCLSNIACLGVDEIGMKLPTPDYKNCLPRRNGITDKSLKRFNN